MNQTSNQLFEQIRPCVALFADLWGVSVPMASELCQVATTMMASRLTYQKIPYKFTKATIAIFRDRLSTNTLVQLKKYALPTSFFDKQTLAEWHCRYPAFPAKETLCLVGLVLVWLEFCRSIYQRTPTLSIGQPMALPYHAKPSFTVRFGIKQRAWVGVGVFLLILGLIIWQTLPEPPPKPTPTPNTHKPIYDVAIVRIDDER